MERTLNRPTSAIADSQMMRPSACPAHAKPFVALPHRSPHSTSPSAPLLLQKCNAGFGSGAGSSSPSSSSSSSKPPSNNADKKKKPRISRYFEDAEALTTGTPSVTSDWIEMPDVDAVQTFVTKPIKPLILKTGTAVMLYKVGDTIYCSDANSTAYSYPLADGNILGLKSGPAIEVKLDGTVYDLATGKVISWCPKNTPVRNLLGSLKDKSTPVDLPVYPVRVEGSKVFVKLVK